MDARSHWENVYTTKAPDAVSWYRPHLETSLELKEKVARTRLRRRVQRTSTLLAVGSESSGSKVYDQICRRELFRRR